MRSQVSYAMLTDSGDWHCAVASSAAVPPAHAQISPDAKPLASSQDDIVARVKKTFKWNTVIHYHCVKVHLHKMRVYVGFCWWVHCGSLQSCHLGRQAQQRTYNVSCSNNWRHRLLQQANVQKNAVHLLETHTAFCAPSTPNQSGASEQACPAT